MSKWFKIALIAVLAVAIAFTGVSVATAHDDGPPEPPEAPWGPRQGRGPERGMGLLAEYRDIVHEGIAEVLGISVSEFEAARDEGQRLFELAEAHGVELEELRSAMKEIHQEILDQAVEDGVLSQQRADWMQQNHRRRGRPGPWTDGCHSHGPRRGGAGGFGSGGGGWNGGS